MEVEVGQTDTSQVGPKVVWAKTGVAPKIRKKRVIKKRTILDLIHYLLWRIQTEVSRGLVNFIVILSLFISLVLTSISSIQAADNLDLLARCLREHSFTMYGTKVCSACEVQREYFGDSFKLIPYVDCNEQAEVCRSKNINAYPTWEDKEGKKYIGAISPEVLAQLSGCSFKTGTAGKTSVITLNKMIAAFLAGLFSFLAPCLLPLFPVYLTVISGFTFTELYGLDFSKLRFRVMISSLFFIAGFSLVYTILGATGSIIGKILSVYLSSLLRISGIILIVLGLLQTGIIKIHALQFDFAWNIQRRLKRLGYLTATVTGIAAALSWIPCVGALLSPILLLATQSETVIYGAMLLFVYSMGLTLPFFFGGLFFPVVVNGLQKYRKMFHWLSVTAGIFLMIFGVILILDKYTLVLEEFYSFVGKLFPYKRS